MVQSHDQMFMRKYVASVGGVVVLAVFLTVSPGCANSGTVAAVRKIHSMTPCGMMMGMAAGHGQGVRPTDEEEHKTTPPETKPPLTGEEVEAHSPSPPSVEQ